MFTSLEYAFRHPNISGMGGWLLLVGYIGTMALYTYTFDVYGSAINATLFGAMAGLACLKTAGLCSRGGYAW